MRDENYSSAGQCRAVFLVVLVLSVLAIMSWPQTSRAVAFTVNYDSGQSDAPSYDSSGDGLVDMVEAAAAMYSDIFEDTESITIHCWWEDLPDNVKGGHELVDQNGDGTMVMQGGKYTAPKFFQAAELVVETDVSTISSRSVFLGQGKSNLSADLRLEQSALIVAGAQFAGDGDLIIATGCQLNIEDGATIGVDLVSEGRISPGSSPGHAAIDGDLTMIGGSLEIEIDLVALAAGSDRLSITGQAALDGNLVIVETVYAPLNIGDSLTIMIFGSRSGVFSSITQNPSGSNPSLACIYGTNDIILRATLPGDINLDDRVDDLDVTITCCQLANPLNGDGQVNTTDATILAANWQQGVMPSVSIPEPSMMVSLLGLLLAGLCLHYRSRNW